MFARQVWDVLKDWVDDLKGWVDDLKDWVDDLKDWVNGLNSCQDSELIIVRPSHPYCL